MNTSMDISLFTTTIIQKMQSRMGRNYTIYSSIIKKNNGVELIGIVMKEKDCNISPTIYINDFYEEYRRGIALEKIIEKLSELFMQNQEMKAVNLSGFTDYEQAKKQIAFKLINYEKNWELLKEIPHKIFYNLAIVFYYVVMEAPFDGSASILIRHSHLKSWNISESELFLNAMVNTPVMLPARIDNMENVMMRLYTSSPKEDREKIEALQKEQDSDTTPLYVLSNRKKILGAACMLYPGVLKKFADKMQCNFWILPSSIHEGATC